MTKVRPATHIALLALVFAGFGCSPAYSVVSMESLHLQAPPKGFEGEIDLSAGGASGNTDKTDLTAGTRLQWHSGIRTDFILLSHAYGETKDVRDNNRSFAHARHIEQFRDALAWEAFLQGERDEFARIAHRYVAGGGARVTLLERRERSAAFLGAGAFHEWLSITDLAGATDTGTGNTWRANLYIVIKHHLNTAVRLVGSLYYQPSLRDAGDYRALGHAVVEVSLTDKLGLRLGAEARRNNRPPETVEKTDVTWRTGLNYRF